MEEIKPIEFIIHWLPANKIWPGTARPVLVLLEDSTWLKAVYAEGQWWQDTGEKSMSGISRVKFWADLNTPYLGGLHE